MKNKYNLNFKRLIVIFWCLWWLVAFWTDIIGAVSHLGMLKASWAPDSNYPFLVKSLKMYLENDLLPAVLFTCIVICSGISFLLFLKAVCMKYTKDKWYTNVNMAFIFSMVYWMLFFLADQIVMNYDLEQNHMVQGGFELLSYLAIHLLPDEC